MGTAEGLDQGGRSVKCRVNMTISEEISPKGDSLDVEGKDVVRHESPGWTRMEHLCLQPRPQLGTAGAYSSSPGHETGPGSLPSS